MLIHNGQQVQNSSFACEILEGADIAQYQINGDKIVLRRRRRFIKYWQSHQAESLQ